MFLLRFDMRAPDFGAPTKDLYAAALEMAVWAEQRGCLQIVVSEHHGSPDGYLPSPLILAAAIAGRTRSVPIQVGALIVPLHDPIRLAEEMAVLDHVSGGRVSYVTAVGYVPEEFAMAGVALEARGRRMDECLDALRKAWTGESFDYAGRRVRVTPTPMTPGGPLLWMGGNTRAAARRAARFDMGMLAQGMNPELVDIYAAECAKLGKTPKACINPPSSIVTSAFIAEDPDRAWAEFGPHLLHDARMYASWLGAAASVSKSTAGSVDELRAQQAAYRIFTPGEAVAYVRANGVLLLQPLCGGLAPEFAWSSLELLDTKVLPALRA